MGTAVAIGRKMIRFANSLVNRLVLVAVLLLLVFSCYSIWDSNQVFRAAEAARYEKYKPTEKNQGLSFHELQELNPDVFAWLTVYGTNIDYPVLQESGKTKYINHNPEGKYSLAGSIFIDTRCARDFMDFSSIIYGHHMEKKAMFGEIGLFADKNFFEARRYGTLYYGGQEHGLEFFAFISTTAQDAPVYQARITEQADRQAYLELLMSRASHTRADVTVTTNDRIILLSTCAESATNGRSVLVGKITDEIHGDSFEKKTMDAQHPVIDQLTGLWAQAPVWCKVILASLPFLLILLALVLTYRKKKRKSQNGKSGEGDNGHEE